MILKIIRHQYSKFQILGAIVGSVVGLFLLSISVQFYIDLNNLLVHKEDLINPEYIVVNKKVSALNTIRQSRVSFSEEELQALSAQDFVDEMTPFISSQFKVSVSISSGKNFPGLYTDLFFEAVPDRFLDIESEEWKWDRRTKFIPIIIPKDYINLYNFGFSGSQGMPQVPDNLLSAVTSEVTINGNGKSDVFRGRIVGFTDRINSVLVPYKFLSWANREYGRTESEKPARVVIVTDDPSSPYIYQYLNDMGFQTNKEKVRNSKLSILLKFMMYIVAAIAVVIVFLSALVFILSFQLILTRNKERLLNLVYLGYHYSRIRNVFILHFSWILAVIILITYFVIRISKFEFTEYLSLLGFEVSKSLDFLTLSVFFSVSFLLFIINIAMANRQLKRLA